VRLTVSQTGRWRRSLAILACTRKRSGPWVRQEEADHGERTNLLSTAERDELNRLRAENNELRRAYEILKAGRWTERSAMDRLCTTPRRFAGARATTARCTSTGCAGVGRTRLRPALPAGQPVEEEVARHYATVRLSEDFRAVVTGKIDAALADSTATRNQVRKQLTKRMRELTAQEDHYFDLVGNPDWPHARVVVSGD